MDFTTNGVMVGEDKLADPVSQQLMDKRKLRVASCGGIFCTILLIAVIPHYINLSRRDTRQPVSIPTPQRYHTDLKYILFWGMMPLIEDGQSMFVNQKCKRQNCFVTYNRSLLNGDIRNFDALVFNIMNVAKETINTSIPRSPNQVYIFRSMEAATKRPVCDARLDNFFNWTWTYKLSSDIPHPFFNIYNTERTELLGPRADMRWPSLSLEPFDNTIFRVLKRKKRALAWIISGCTADEQDFTYFSMLQKELEKLNLSAHIYGPCAQSCPNNQLKKCYKLVEEKYFFNFVVEDYNGEDFVGEKLLKSLQYATIPIVRGVSNYSRFLPPRSYLEATQPARLAATMSHLINHPRNYLHFFDWANHYSYVETQRSDVCDLCARMNEEIGQKTRRNLRSWWNPRYEEKCMAFVK